MVDFRLSARRDVATAEAFFAKAINSEGMGAETVTLDRYAASARSLKSSESPSDANPDV
jgi:putative transposase